MSKTFSQYAIEKINDVFANQSKHVGSQLKLTDPAKYRDYIASDCITMAIWVLKYAFEKTLKPEAARRVGGLGQKGTELAKYLIEHHGWKAVYYNPDVNHPRDSQGEHIASYYNQVKKSCSYSVSKVPVSNTVINYQPSDIKVTEYLGPTKKIVTDYNVFKRVPFGLGMSRGGLHVWLYSLEKIYESHWEKEANKGLYTAVKLNEFEWLSGIIVVPPDSHHLLNVSTVKCN